MRIWITIPMSEGSIYMWNMVGNCKHVPIFGATNDYIRFCVEDTCPFFRFHKGQIKEHT